MNKSFTEITVISGVTGQTTYRVPVGFRAIVSNDIVYYVSENNEFIEAERQASKVLGDVIERFYSSDLLPCSCCQEMDGERRLKILGITDKCPKCHRVFDAVSAP